MAHRSTQEHRLELDTTLLDQVMDHPIFEEAIAFPEVVDEVVDSEEATPSAAFGSGDFI